jgi:hypothetical protein
MYEQSGSVQCIPREAATDEWVETGVTKKVKTETKCRLDGQRRSLTIQRQDGRILYAKSAPDFIRLTCDNSACREIP